MREAFLVVFAGAVLGTTTCGAADDDDSTLLHACLTKHGEGVLVLVSDDTRGRMSLAFPDVWQRHVAEVMAELKP